MLNLNASDTIDRLVNLSNQQQTYTTRHEREKLVSATQGSEDGLFDPELPGLSLEERLCVALYACLLTPAHELTTEYEGRLAKLHANGQTLTHIKNLSIQAVEDTRLQAMLNFTRMLITKPINADKQALLSLTQAGLETAEVVTLAQLISFVSYQVRLVAGLKAMRALEYQS